MRRRPARGAARDRAARGEGKPETFTFLGFTHICATSRRGRFWVRRKTGSKRVRAKLAEVKAEIRRRLPAPLARRQRRALPWEARPAHAGPHP